VDAAAQSKINEAALIEKTMLADQSKSIQLV